MGKSSLLNKLMYRKGLAKVSSTPGKTATINFYDVDGHDLVDLPGYGYAKVSKAEKGRWSELIEGYYNQDRDFALVVSLIDIRHEPSALDRNMVQFLMDAELPFAIALTKADKLSKQQQMKQRAAIKKALQAAGWRTHGGDVVGEGRRHRRAARPHQPRHREIRAARLEACRKPRGASQAPNHAANRKAHPPWSRIWRDFPISTLMHAQPGGNRKIAPQTKLLSQKGERPSGGSGR